ncbi:MAG: EF-hand domain-containing protein [Paracoccaceae bacterium]|nr:EF-hand domain-containing protein [Paracoccaceae bacterium]
MKLFNTSLIAAVIFPVAVWAGEAPGSHFIENWDLDGNGAVTLAELTERRSDIFASFDQNDDGRLSAEEYVAFDEARASDVAENGDKKGKGEKRMQKGMQMDFNDVNGDGYVSRQEFLDRTAAWLKIIDRNGDGQVTAADFGKK